MGWDGVIWYSDSLRDGESEDRIPSRPALGPTMGTGTFPWEERPGRGVNQLPPPSPEVKESAEL